MVNSSLDYLVSIGVILYYEYDNVSEDGYIRKESPCRNTQRLKIYFPNTCTYNNLVINTFCSGSNQNTSMDIKHEG